MKIVSAKIVSIMEVMVEDRDGFDVYRRFVDNSGSPYWELEVGDPLSVADENQMEDMYQQFIAEKFACQNLP